MSFTLLHFPSALYFWRGWAQFHQSLLALGCKLRSMPGPRTTAVHYQNDCTPSSWTLAWCPDLLTAVWLFWVALSCHIMLPLALFCLQIIFKLFLQCCVDSRKRLECLFFIPGSRVWCIPMILKILSLQKVSIWKHLPLFNWREIELQKERLMQMEAASIYQGLMQKFTTWRCI